MGAIRRAESGEWIISYTGASGRVIELHTKAPRTEADADLLLHHCEMQACAVRATGIPLPPRPTSWRQIWEWWSEISLPRYSAEWRRTQKLLVEKFLLPVIGNLCAGEIRPMEIRSHLAALIASGTLKPSSANAIRAVGATVVQEAMADGRWPQVGNPFHLFRPFRVPRQIWPTLTTEEARQLIQGTQGRRRTLWALALYLGLRRGELFALRISDFDFRRRALVVARSHDRETTKNGNARQLPITDELWNIISPYLADIPREALVFPGRTGNLLHRSHKLPRNLRTDLAATGVVSGWEARCRCGWKQPVTTREEKIYCPTCGKKCRIFGIPPSIRAHDLRHTFATLATEAGVSPDVVRLTLGHLGGVTAIYQHLSLEAMRRELSRLSIVPLAS